MVFIFLNFKENLNYNTNIVNEKDKEYFHNIYLTSHRFLSQEKGKFSCKTCNNDLEQIKQAISACFYLYPSFTTSVFCNPLNLADIENMMRLNVTEEKIIRQASKIKYPLNEYSFSNLEFKFIDKNYDGCEVEFFI